MEEPEPEQEPPADQPVHKHAHHGIQRIADKVRGMGVGTEDPNIIGDAGPTDIPPGSDPPRPLVEDDDNRS